MCVVIIIHLKEQENSSPLKQRFKKRPLNIQKRGVGIHKRPWIYLQYCYIHSRELCFLVIDNARYAMSVLRSWSLHYCMTLKEFLWSRRATLNYVTPWYNITRSSRNYMHRCRRICFKHYNNNNNRFSNSKSRSARGQTVDNTFEMRNARCQKYMQLFSTTDTQSVLIQWEKQLDRRS